MIINEEVMAKAFHHIPVFSELGNPTASCGWRSLTLMHGAGSWKEFIVYNGNLRHPICQRCLAYLPRNCRLYSDNNLREYLHNLLDELPEEGLSELAESLPYMIEYWKTMPEYKPIIEKKEEFLLLKLPRIIKRPLLIIE